MANTLLLMHIGAFLLLAAASAAFAALEVEHSIGGSNFRPAGKLVGNLLSDLELEWQRPALTSDDMELVEAALKRDGLYSVRVKTDKGTLLSSVPAKCLLLKDLKEHVVLAAAQDGFVEAFNYDIKACSSSSASATGGGSDSADAYGVGGAGGRPERLSVRVTRPSPGPLLTLPEVMGEFADVAVDSVDIGGGMGSAAYDPNAKPRAVPGGGQAGARKGGPPPKDERTWLQKNWLIVVAVGMMVLNLVAKAQAPPPGQGGPGAAAGAGAGAGAASRRA